MTIEQSRIKILVTGGTGYIGGRIVEGLVKFGYSVLISTRQQQLHTVLAKLENVSFINYHSVFDAHTPLPVNIECIIHLSAFNEIDSELDVLMSAEVNTIHSLRLLEKAKTAGVKKFVYFSTIHVYGAPLKGEINENNRARPIHPYAISHRSFEDYLLAARDKNEIDGIVFRLSNAIGKPLFPEVNRWSLLVNELCKESIQHNRLTLKSSGFQQRDFIGISDVVGAVLHVLRLGKDKTHDGLFNLGGNCSMSVGQIAQVIKNRTDYLFDKNPDLNFIGNNLYDSHNGIKLTYLSDKFISTGFLHVSNVENEIDEMLIFCQTHFKSENN